MNITSVTVSKKRTIDHGFAPYLEYLQTHFHSISPDPKRVPFGMKEDAKDEMFIALSANLGEEDEIGNTIDQLVEIIDANLDLHMGTRVDASVSDTFEVSVTKKEESGW